MSNFEKLKKIGKKDKVLLLFSGGLDTSFLVKFLTQEYECEVYTLYITLGGERDDADIEKKALSLGAKKHMSVDLEKEFAQNYCLEAVFANAQYYESHPLCSSLSRPLMAEKSVEIANSLKIQNIIHGAEGWQNNAARFNAAVKAINPKIKIHSPIIDLQTTREKRYEYLLKYSTIALGKRTKENLFSHDVNLWGTEIEDGCLGDIDYELPENLYMRTSSLDKAPNAKEKVTIFFEKGIPQKINGKKMTFPKLIKYIDQLAAKHGIGRYDTLESRAIGIKNREVHEMPAATVLIQAHRELERTILCSRSLRFKSIAETEWVDLVINGHWFSPLRFNLSKLFQNMNKYITGEVFGYLFKGQFHITGRNSKFSLDQKNQKDFLQYSAEDMITGFYEYHGFEQSLSYHQKYL